MLHRFFVAREAIGKFGVLFPEETAHQIRKVLRLRQGDMVTVLDGSGVEYAVRLEKITNEKVWGSLQGQQQAGGEPVLQIFLYLSLTQREKFEWALQKCTEVGVSAFVPVISDRTLARDKEQALQKKERWERILKEAAEQSGRGRIPQINAPLALAEALNSMHGQDFPAVFLWENETRHLLYGWLLENAVRIRQAGRLALFVGPEGGYTQEEAASANDCGVRTMSLGERILRMETAAVVACALPLQVLG